MSWSGGRISHSMPSFVGLFSPAARDAPTLTPTDREMRKTGGKIQSSVCVFAGIFLPSLFHRRIPCHIFFSRDLLACHRTAFQSGKKSRRQGIIVFCLAVKGSVGAKRRSATEPGDEVRKRDTHSRLADDERREEDMGEQNRKERLRCKRR